MPQGKEVDICLAVIKSTSEFPPHRMGQAHVISDAAFRRKPLATAHSCLASLLSQMPGHFVVHGSAGTERVMIGNTFFHEWMSAKGLYEDSRDFHAVITEHYHRAAHVQLLDAGDAAILWWGYGGNMVRSSERGDGQPGGYRLGELRHAIAMARKCAAQRDALLFGKDDSVGGSFEAQATVTAQHFVDKENSFVLPGSQLISSTARPGALRMVIQGECVCEDMSRFM
jgi:hypothetical protein